MNNSIKISLSITVQGSTLVRKSKVDKINFNLTKKDLNSHVKGKEANDTVREGYFEHYSLENKPASYHINLTQDAYDYMTSVECPNWFHKPKEWKKMKPMDRLTNHMKRICDSYNGKSFSYDVLED